MPLDITERIRLITISPESTVRQAMQTVEAGALGIALVVDPTNGRFQYLLTDGDIRRALLNGIGLESVLGLVSHPKPTFVHASAPREEVLRLFSEAIRVIPVLDQADRVVDLALFDRRTHLPVAQPLLGEAELVNVMECILTGWISSTGRFVGEFERRCADYCKTPYAIATSNGTTALHLAMLALDIGPGDEVIVPTLTFIATANAVTYTGAKAVFVDSEPNSWNLDPAAVERAITPRTKAVIAVHLYGHMAEMKQLLEICKRKKLFLVEDAAEAFGSVYHGQRAGSFGDISTFSFFGNKIITTGEGGMITTHSRVLAERCRVLRDHGMSPQKRYWHEVLGYNYRMTNLQAAVGVGQLTRIHSIIAAKRRIAQEYLAALHNIPGLCLPVEPPNTSSVYWLVSICVDPSVFGADRDQLMASLKTANIETRPVFPVLHRQPIYARSQNLPVAERISARGLSLPSDPTLSRSEIERIVGHIRHLSVKIGSATQLSP
jgi:perosamine synthetase